MAKLDQVRIQIVPDNFTRKALLETGDADVAGIDFKDLPDLVAQGFVTTGAGGGSEWILWFAGNYWEKTHAITGEPIDWGQIHSHSKQHAWRAHPDDAEDMENARKVRNALAMAIDRELMVETLTGASAGRHTWDFSVRTILTGRIDGMSPTIRLGQSAFG